MKRDKGGGRVSVDNSDGDTESGSDGENDLAEDVIDLLGSSFMTSGEESPTSIAFGGNDSKKLRLDDQVLIEDDLGDGVEASISSENQPVVSQGQKYDMDTGKGEGSSEEEELSSGDTGNALPPDNNRVEGMEEM